MQVIAKERIESENSVGEDQEENGSIDLASALQTYLNSIPISSFPDISGKPVQVLEVNAGDTLRDAIHKLYQQNAPVAFITDILADSSESSDTSSGTALQLSDHYIGVISFATMFLWCIERFHKDSSNHSHNEKKKQTTNNFFSSLDQNPHIKQTKIADLAKLFLWDPFFPVHFEDDTLFHVLLLLSKHKLQVVPVIQQSKNQVTGFISQHAVIKLLLKSEGLEWFDSIANAPLSELCFEGKDSASQVYADQSVSEALSVLSEKRVSAVAVIDRKTKMLVGTVKNSDISLFLRNDTLFTDIKSTTVAQYIKRNVNGKTCNANDEDEQNVCRENNQILRTKSPVVHKETLLKKVMSEMVETKSETSFLVDESCNVLGMITLRDIISEFAPPCMDSRIDGGGFFQTALQQTGCHVDHGTMVYDK